ncbi:sulfatase [Flammeovirga sp. OC4]|uniref:sulfatase family protein n=1 Tax=Flammeovirga sp. OC4 TaxID=1382345 RepID=UPI0009E2E473|nr:sulfatase-like hydrolase/transferase [Flammeovirga sp. OC4]
MMESFSKPKPLKIDLGDYFFLFFFLLVSGNTTSAQNQQLEERMNILWLVTEDMGHYIPSFGDSTIATPNLSRLAEEGVAYPNFYSTSGVCAPSRAAIATGMYPSSFGANHMRTNSYTEVTGLPAYEAVPPTEAKMLSELLRAEGYYCTNNLKEDYQFKYPITAWDESSPYAHWRNRKEKQPFFAVFNFTNTHESGLFEPYGFRAIENRHYHSGDTSFHWEKGKMTEEETTIYLSKETEFSIPPYLPQTEVVQRDLWKMYNNIAEMDAQVGAILAQLEQDGLLENTIIFFYGDHGGPLPREKRLVYDSGLKTPLIIRFPKKLRAKQIDAQLLSFIDLAPSLLSLVDVKTPQYMHGKAFLGRYATQEKRKYIHAAADRFDGYTDAIRAVRDKQFKYIRNYRPEQGYYLPITYREKIPSMQELLRLKAKGELNGIQLQWFREQKPTEELFDCQNDPYELYNLAENPKYRAKLLELRTEMDRWLTQIDDDPTLSEKELITKLWKGEKQPQTQPPKVVVEEGMIQISCSTEGASIGYRLKNNKKTNSWAIYNQPFSLKEGEIIEVKAHRIGFLPSEVIYWRETDYK